VIGFLSGAPPDPQAYRVRMMRQGLSEIAYNEGRNLAIEYRCADNHNDRLPELAADLVRRKVRVIVTLGLPAALAAKAATTAMHKTTIAPGGVRGTALEGEFSLTKLFFIFEAISFDGFLSYHCCS
jgi:hypothetical protein